MHAQRKATFLLGIIIATFMFELVAIAEAGGGGGGGGHKKGGHQNNMEELLILTGILAKVLQKQGGGHHKSHPIPIPIFIPMHHHG
ncbi:hypothetical protein X975_22549, partial [Stegodyphus mimosarum]